MPHTEKTTSIFMISLWLSPRC